MIEVTCFSACRDSCSHCKETTRMVGFRCVATCATSPEMRCSAVATLYLIIRLTVLHVCTSKALVKLWFAHKVGVVLARGQHVPGNQVLGLLCMLWGHNFYAKAICSLL